MFDTGITANAAITGAREHAVVSPDEASGGTPDERAARALDRIGGIERQIAVLQAERARVLAEFAALRPSEQLGRVFSEFAADEVSMAVGWSRQQAAKHLALAVDLTGRLRPTLTALADARIDGWQAQILSEALAGVDDTLVGVIQDRVLDGIDRLTTTQLRRRLRVEIAAVDPDGDTRRHETARAERRVEYTPLPDGMGSIWALLPAQHAVALHEHLSRVARDAEAGDERTMDQRRADALVSSILGDTGVSVQVQVTVPITALIGQDQQPAELDGYGPINADTARELAYGAHAVWRRLLTDPASGTVLDVGRSRYRPPAAMAEHVTIRDRTCVFPTCTHPAATCDLDHTVAWEDGGSTAAHNLAPLCRHHHRAKHEGRFQLTQPAPGQFEWRAPSGVRRTRPG